MNLKNNIFIIWFICALVGIYQLPLIENKLLSYEFSSDINKYFPYSQIAQQQVENYKIMLTAGLDNASIDNIQKEIPKPANNHLIKTSVASAVTVKNELADVSISANFSPCQVNCKVLMIGDSVMGDVAFSLTRLMSKNQPTWKIITAHKVSSGLSNNIYYDWPTTSHNLVDQHKPDYVLVMMGTNDAVNIGINGKSIALGSTDWNKNYSLRMNKINDYFKEKNVIWNWIQLPVVRSPNFNKKLQSVRDIQQLNAKQNMIETESLFGSVAQKTPLDMSIRNTDGIHLNTKGANLVASHVYKYMNTHYVK